MKKINKIYLNKFKKQFLIDFIFRCVTVQKQTDCSNIVTNVMHVKSSTHIIGIDPLGFY